MASIIWTAVVILGLAALLCAKARSATPTLVFGVLAMVLAATPVGEGFAAVVLGAVDYAQQTSGGAR